MNLWCANCWQALLNGDAQIAKLGRRKDFSLAQQLLICNANEASRWVTSAKRINILVKARQEKHQKKEAKHEEVYTSWETIAQWRGAGAADNNSAQKPREKPK